MSSLLLKNFRIVDETTDARGSVLVEDGIIKEVFIEKDNDNSTQSAANITARYAEYNADTVIGGRNLALMPAFVDLHAHFREPGFSEKETLESACLAATAGGYGTVVCMANTAPATDSLLQALSVRERTTALGLVDVYPALSLTQKMEGKALSEITLLAGKDQNPNPDISTLNPHRNIRLLSEDGKDVADDPLFLAAMAEARRTGIPISCHCDLDGENNATRRVIELGKIAGCHIHIAHVSTKEAVEMIREAKKTIPGNTGFSLTCEATPHHIALTEKDAAALGAETHGRVSPPLRTEEDRQALIAAIVDGTVDAIATDHAPHTQADKEKSAPGFSGLETAFAVCYSTLVLPGYISLSKLSSLMSAAPARILVHRRHGKDTEEEGVHGGHGRDTDEEDRGRIAPGLRADFAVADLSARWTVDPAAFKSRGKNSPFAERELCGRIAMTIRGGSVVFQKA